MEKYNVLLYEERTGIDKEAIYTFATWDSESFN